MVVEFNQEGYELFSLPRHTLRASAEVREGTFPNLRHVLLRRLGGQAEEAHRFFRTFDNDTRQETVTVELDCYATDTPPRPL